MNHLSTRRRFLLGATGAVAGFGLFPRSGRANPTTRSVKNKIKLCPHLLDEKSPKDIEIVQITTDSEVPSSHIYMEAQIFTPDNKRFILQRSGHAHGSDRKDPKHQFMVCDIENNFALQPLTDEIGTAGPSLSPDGKCLYYFVDQTEVNSGRLILKQVNLDGTDRQTIMVLDHPLPGTKFRASQVYPLSTISSDGKRLAISAFLGDGSAAGPPFGLLIFDLKHPSVELIVHGPTWSNMHPQFCRSHDPESKRDILIQENHGWEMDAQGRQISISGDGADIHVIRDDGTNLRDLPWGRDGVEACQGHQCWRGQTDWAIAGTGTRKPPDEQRLIESRPLPHAGHIGTKTPKGMRNDLTREFTEPRFCHFGTDIAGKRLITDYKPFGPDARIYMGLLGAPGEAPLSEVTCLLQPKTSGKSKAHSHPFLSPDGRLGFFNSDESGQLQAYMVRGFS